MFVRMHIAGVELVARAVLLLLQRPPPRDVARVLVVQSTMHVHSALEDCGGGIPEVVSRRG